MFVRNARKYFLLDGQVQIFQYGSTLTSKYCKTGVRERTLLKN